jgi:hypothetical protein
MSKLSKIFTCLAFAAGLALALPGAAQAGHWHGHHGWHGGWHHHWHGGFGPGFVLGFGFGAPYYRPYYYGGDCGWVTVRYWRYGRWHWRRVWRCW